MTRVAVLPDALANQIAAGEVVERPASVVKELVENAIDAEASRVVIAIEEGGRKLIRVVDDGHGMGPDDARLAVLRHATSKIRSTDDLNAIGTLGFRGEALPSIGSVSRFTLVSRRTDDQDASEIVIEGGASTGLSVVGAPVGTRVEVRDLFFNVPARLKFLKRRSTEVSHIKGFVNDIALAYPTLHIKLTSDGRTLCDYPSAKRLDQRILQVLGKATARRMYRVSVEGEVAVHGYISEPGFARTNQQGIHTFVNGRRVRDRTVTHAIVSSYVEHLTRGQFPLAVIYVHVPPDSVDVNVHPAKAEVRFVRPGDVHDTIVRACRLTLAEAPWAGLPGLGRPAPGPPPRPPSREGHRPTGSWAPRPPRNGPSAWSTRYRPDGTRQPQPVPVRRQELVFQTTEQVAVAAASRPNRWLGQAHERYWIVEQPGVVWLLDKTRVALELAAEALRQTPVAASPLLIPAVVEVGADASATLKDWRTPLTALGLEFEAFGHRTWQVLAVPAVLSGAPPQALLLTCARELAGTAPPLADDSGTTTLPAALMGRLASHAPAPPRTDAQRMVDAVIALRGERGLDGLGTCVTVAP